MAQTFDHAMRKHAPGMVPWVDAILERPKDRGPYLVFDDRLDDLTDPRGPRLRVLLSLWESMEALSVHPCPTIPSRGHEAQQVADTLSQRTRDEGMTRFRTLPLWAWLACRVSTVQTEDEFSPLVPAIDTLHPCPSAADWVLATAALSWCRVIPYHAARAAVIRYNDIAHPIPPRHSPPTTVDQVRAHARMATAVNRAACACMRGTETGDGTYAVDAVRNLGMAYLRSVRSETPFDRSANAYWWTDVSDVALDGPHDVPAPVVWWNRRVNRIALEIDMQLPRLAAEFGDTMAARTPEKKFSKNA